MFSNSMLNNAQQVIENIVDGNNIGFFGYSVVNSTEAFAANNSLSSYHTVMVDDTYQASASHKNCYGVEKESGKMRFILPKFFRGIAGVAFIGYEANGTGNQYSQVKLVYGSNFSSYKGIGYSKNATNNEPFSVCMPFCYTGVAPTADDNANYAIDIVSYAGQKINTVGIILLVQY